jgi:hypothetical protein
MSTATMAHVYPIDREELFAFLADPANLPRYYNGIVDLTVPARFTEPGDEVTFRYRVLGRTVDARARLLDRDPGVRLRTRSEADGIPSVEHDWHHEDVDEGTRVTVTMATDGVDSWFGRAIDRLVLPRHLEKDLARSLENIEELVALGFDRS